MYEFGVFTFNFNKFWKYNITTHFLLFNGFWIWASCLDQRNLFPKFVSITTSSPRKRITDNNNIFVLWLFSRLVDETLHSSKKWICQNIEERPYIENCIKTNKHFNFCCHTRTSPNSKIVLSSDNALNPCLLDAWYKLRTFE